MRMEGFEPTLFQLLKLVPLPLGYIRECGSRDCFPTHSNLNPGILGSIPLQLPAPEIRPDFIKGMAAPKITNTKTTNT